MDIQRIKREAEDRIDAKPGLFVLIFLAVFLLLGNAIVAMATGKAEVKPIEITVLHTPSALIPANTPYRGPLKGPDHLAAIWAALKVSNPEIAVKGITIDLSTGAAMSMDALVASGQAPDVLFDAPMRAAKYMVPEYALALNDYVKDWDDYYPDVLNAVTRNGKIYGLPWATWLTTMNTNTELLARAGYEVKPGWTTDDFVDMCKKVKALNDGSFGTYLFAGNQSSDQWWMPFFAAFGARYYAPGDYSKNTLNSPQAVAALKWMKSLVDNGYVPKGAASLTDTEVLTMFKAGKIATGSMQAVHPIGAQFKFKFVEFPRVPGGAGVGCAAGTTSLVVKASKDEARNKAAVVVAHAITNPESQRLYVNIISGGYMTRKSVTDKGLLNERDDEILAVMRKNGVLDMGITMPKFTPIRAMMFPLLQQFYSGKMSAEDVMKTYEANVNKELATK